MADHYCSVCDSVLGKSTGVFSPQAAYIAPSGTMTAGHQGEFPGQFRISFSMSATEVCGISYDSLLPSTYGIQPRAMAVV